MRGLVWLCLALSGCAIGEGHGFVTVEESTLRVALEPGAARDLGGGTILTDLGFEVTLATATVAIGAVSLDELTGTGGGGSFDPSSPPAGYTLCHGGHCHSDDGRLVPYAEIEAELAGGGAVLAPVLELPVDRSFELLASRTVVLDDGETELPRASLSRARVTIEGLGLSGSVTGGTLGDRTILLRVGLPLSAVAGEGLEYSIDRSGPGRIAVAVELIFGGRFFDGLDFAALEDGGALHIRNLDDPGAEAIAAALAAHRPKITFEERK